MNDGERGTRLAQALSEARTESFGPMFSDRVVARIREARQAGDDTLYNHLRWMFSRVAIAGTAVALILGAYNATEAPPLSSTVVETLFGLPSPDMESVIMLADA
jgi:hypothetical protein